MLIHRIHAQLVLPVVACLALASCTADRAATGATVAGATAAPSASATAACVTNAAAVAAKPVGATTTAVLPVSVVSGLNAAAKATFAQAASPGAIVGVRTPEGTWTAAYGYADPTTKAPMTTDMHMRIGSVTKTFTGTLILQLAQEGKLSLNDTIDKYYPGIPNGDRITLAELANMTSGIASYYTEAFLTKYFAHPETIFTPDQLIGYGVAASPVFEPGAQFDYSNTNTILLGKVVEKVTGHSVEEALQQQILAPLGLMQTSLPTTSPVIPQPHPQGYTLQGGAKSDAPTNATNWSPSFGWTAGGMISTLGDLLTYDRALGTGQGLLPEAMQVERLGSFPTPAGYGLALGCVDGWIGHTGELPGFNTALYYDTRTDTSVVVLVNSDIPSGDCSESQVLSDNPTDIPCSSPATRIFVGLSTALGHEFHPLPSK